MNEKDDYDRTANVDVPADSKANAKVDDEAEDVSQIRQDIEQTRAGMSETIDELQERLSPSYVKEQVKEHIVEQFHQVRDTIRDATIGKVENMIQRASDTAYETRRGVVDTIKANPVPSAIVGLGLAWLWLNRETSPSYRSSGYRDADGGWRNYGADDDASTRRYSGYGGYSRTGRQSYGDSGSDFGSARGLASKAGDAISEASSQVQETASNIAGKARDAAYGVAGKARDAAHDVAGKAQETAAYVADKAQQTARVVTDKAQYQARRVEQSFQSAMRDNPLAVGAVALAVGAAVGLAVPQTRKESEWMGEARDNLVDKAQSVASSALQKVQEVAERVTDDIAAPSHTQSYQSSQTSQPGLST